ncbi:hypothetical protein N4G69_40265 [Streptomyces mirabilis]|uniref:hypothetical protein n=1 Tax=Streptomyces mirabilis TaxID=68239 RepID=UPI0021BFA0B7|nr:hypothetical protein [Streptomyces mirabilis]MCT9111749.1 hypothetical protein [Streptomyces mirabilis]
MRAHISRSPVSRSGISRSRGILLPPLVGAAPVCGPVGRADHDAVFHPLLDVLSAVAERGGRLDAAEAAGFTRALETANASVERRLKERASATSAASAAPGVTGVTDRAGVAVADPVTVADPVADLLAQLQSTVDGLVKALTGALGTVTGLLSPVVGVVTGLLGGGLSGLPALPTAGSPATPSR